MTADWKPCPLCSAELQIEEAGFEHPYSDTCPLDSIYIMESYREGWNRRAADQADHAARVLAACAALVDRVRELEAALAEIIRQFGGCKNGHMAAPERIWIDRGPRGGWMHRYERVADSKHEYIPADLSQAAIAAAVLAEREACAAMLEQKMLQAVVECRPARSLPMLVIDAKVIELMRAIVRAIRARGEP